MKYKQKIRLLPFIKVTRAEEEQVAAAERCGAFYLFIYFLYILQEHPHICNIAGGRRAMRRELEPILTVRF